MRSDAWIIACLATILIVVTTIAVVPGCKEEAKARQRATVISNNGPDATSGRANTVEQLFERKEPKAQPRQQQKQPVPVKRRVAAPQKRAVAYTPPPMSDDLDHLYKSRIEVDDAMLAITQDLLNKWSQVDEVVETNTNSGN